MNLYTASVAEFIEKFEASKDPSLWAKLIDEEADEVLKSLADFLKEYCDLLYVCAGMRIITGASDDEGLPKLPPYVMYKMTRLLNMLEIILDAFDDETIDEAFSRVHASNMSKLGEDGKPIRRSDGKIQKGPNYKPPELLDLIY